MSIGESRNPQKIADSEEAAAAVAEFLAKGGQVQVAPVVDRSERDNLPRHFVISAEKVKMRLKNRKAKA